MEVFVYVAERRCYTPPEQHRGHKDVCNTPHEFQATCSYECDSGFKLSAPLVLSIECVADLQQDGVTFAMEWDDKPSPCQGSISIRRVGQLFKIYTCSCGQQVVYTVVL